MTNLTTRFQPGNKLGGHGGRPKGARSRLGEKFLENLAADFDEHGETVMQTVRKEDPTAYFTTVAKLLPREVEAKLTVERTLPGNLTADAWSKLHNVVDLIERLAPAVDPADVWATVERALIAAYAEPAPRAIEHQATLAMAPAAIAEPAPIAPPPF